MTLGIDPLLMVVLALVFGLSIGYLLRYFLVKKQAENAEVKAKEIIFKAKDQALKILEEAKNDERLRQGQFLKFENILSKKEKELEEEKKRLSSDFDNVRNKEKEIGDLRIELSDSIESQKKELERIGGVKKEEAKALLLKQIENESKDEIYQKIKKLGNEGNQEIENKARELLISVVQRFAHSQIAEVTTTAVSLPSDEIKGKIIGKEGRNIKAIERLTGVDIIIDETPEALLISGFDPIRRQIAKLTIERLIADGRIHPARIEETVELAKDELEKKIKETGENAIYETGVGPFDPKLVYLLGRLAFRTSFSQNVLQHSIEMAHIAGMLAQELKADVAVAKSAALLHDIGKAVDHEVQGTHVEIGRRILEKFGVDKKVITAMESHHEDYPYASLEARIVQAADAISAARPGARRETVEFYLKRLEDLERIASSFEGVEKSYAVQAGRELRVFVTPTRIDDLGAIKLAREIVKKIENEMKYPGEIKVNVIRETRAIEYAR
ncbi:MAG: ribonuclease Y [Parcubacteria group bacterium RIFCSPHIGHO2_01_FULL_40_30]|nr:MAG: ribonuclease Y [Parcubacteria group bacterium RIFCSPHIGHO2_01_FULL_40_30]OHB22710.1 MAG: ribonuclease Y [Parcubacteria group bacterium RIFCSPLOWO2_02_FULL_40_12]OHB24217.1 MAG: ribonuclease Y [Parcubacteria group bacterium RIFCSPLOWO2_12_FULL_40_10]